MVPACLAGLASAVQSPITPRLKPSGDLNSVMSDLLCLATDKKGCSFFLFSVSAEIQLSEETSEQKQHLETGRLVVSVAGLTESV